MPHRRRGVKLVADRSSRICWDLDERRWVPAWPFLETSPFGLVFAGTTSSFAGATDLLRGDDGLIASSVGRFQIWTPMPSSVIPAAFSPRESGEGIQCRLVNVPSPTIAAS